MRFAFDDRLPHSFRLPESERKLRASHGAPADFREQRRTAMLNEEQLCWCEAHHAEAIDLLRALGRIAAPSGHERRRAEFVRDWLER